MGAKAEAEAKRAKKNNCGSTGMKAVKKIVRPKLKLEIETTM